MVSAEFEVVLFEIGVNTGENIEAGSKVVTAMMFSGLCYITIDVCFFILPGFFLLYMFILQFTIFCTGCASVFVSQICLH